MLSSPPSFAYDAKDSVQGSNAQTFLHFMYLPPSYSYFTVSIHLLISGMSVRPDPNLFPYPAVPSLAHETTPGIFSRRAVEIK